MNVSLVPADEGASGIREDIRSVAIVARVIPHYRVEFLNGLEERLRSSSIRLTVFADYIPPETHLSDGLEEVRCAERVSNNYLGLRRVLLRRHFGSGGASLRPPYWQPILRRLSSFDLAVVEQANAALLNYPLILRRLLLADRPKIAFWGHGANLQADEGGLRRWIKIAMTTQADHWFGYTEHSADILRRLGVKDDIVTIVNNSVDTEPVKSACSLVAASTAKTKAELGLGDTPVAVFCARLTQNKALPFLVDSCRRAREKFGDFTLLVIGDGDHEPWLRRQAQEDSWIRVLGPLYGKDKGAALAISDVFLLPSAVGLSILDAFAAGLPLVSARFGNHGPEIAYLKDHVNGLMTAPDVEAYSDAITEVLGDEAMRGRLSERARQSADIYTVDAMIENFAQGIEQALGLNAPSKGFCRADRESSRP